MAQTLEDQAGALPASAEAQHSTPRPVGQLTVWALALLGGALFATAVLLWARHGATIFFDTMSAGIGSCM